MYDWLGLGRLISGGLGLLALSIGLEFLDRVTGRGLLETTGLELLAAESGLEHFTTVTGLKLFPSGLGAVSVQTLVTDTRVELLTSL